MRIGIAGIGGRMGRLLAEEARAAGELVGGTVRPGSGESGPPGIALVDIATLARMAEVVIDFTHASAVVAHANALAEAGTAWVLGTTGLGASEQAAVDKAAQRIPVVQASNFSAGVTLLLALAEQVAAALPADAYDAEILEMHHRQKVDAPSGTALSLGQAVARGRKQEFAPSMELARSGHTGPRKTGAIGFAVLRGGQVVGEHTLIFAGANEHIALTHRAFDRRVFAQGAMRAARWVIGRPPGRYGMQDVLGLR
ncbi:MAG: 4-hydroxy-tetrahydrodipicolinate reductase [Acidobacteriia bacterium]|nr:4-hydroxy-tetrahydrodipicolinate reductase [Methyloceanibacter sp.]MBX5472043.1 4-hydroxy-tetrahydrodipicolinate reductase [Acetobacteraceae bacterium]MCL6491724.1 4-hydroxy-tetrahydrodipicolinate reductase [Terriglobia bacterium]